MNKVTIFLLVIAILTLNGCNSKGDAEKVAQGFAVALQNHDYGKAYDYFIPSLKEQRSKEDFITYLEAKGTNFNLIYDKVVVQDNKLAYAYYTLSVEGIAQLSPPIKMEYTVGGWKIDGFASYFFDKCVDDCYYQIRDLCEQKFSQFDDQLKCREDIVKGDNYSKCDKSTGFKCKLINVWKPSSD